MNDLIKVQYARVTLDVWLRKYLRKEYKERDFTGLTLERKSNVNVSKTHPFVQVFESVINGAGDTNYTGIFPTVSVTSGRAPEGDKRIGGGDKSQTIFTKKIYNDIIDLQNTENLIAEGWIISDDQIKKLAQMMSVIQNEDGGYVTYRSSFFKRELIAVSIWTDNHEENSILRRLTESILHDARRELSGPRYEIVSYDMSTDPDLFNADFAKPLYGTEIQMEFDNEYANLHITNEIYLDKEYDITFNANYKTTQG